MEISLNINNGIDTSASVPYLFERAGDVLIPTSFTLGPWGDNMHGATITATLVHYLDLLMGTEEFRLARSAVELFRPAPMGNVRLTHAVIRDGSRVRVADAGMEINGVHVARCSGLFLKESSPKGLHMPDLSLGASPPGHEELLKLTRRSSDPPRFMDRAEMRPISFCERDKLSCAWVNVPYSLTSEEPLSPAARAAAAADYLSGLSFTLPEGLRFINSEMTVHLTRAPLHQWICISADLRMYARGTGIARATMSDDEGIFGSCAVAVLATDIMADIQVQ